MKIEDFFSAPVTSDNDGRNLVASYLRTILLVAIVLLPLFVLVKVITSSGIYAADLILSGLTLECVILYILLKKSRIILVSLVLLLSAWAGLTLIAAYADGVKDIAIAGYIILIFLATLVSGARFAIIITGLSILSVWVMGVIQLRYNFIPVGDGILNYSRDYSVLFILVLTAVVLFAKSYRYSYNRINTELQERILAEEKLSKNEIMLREKNEELLISKEKAEQSDRLKTAFLQNISHEIRTPMNGIMGFLELLQFPGIDAQRRKEYMETINSCSHQLASLVNDIMDISRIESGTIEFHLSEVGTEELLSEVEKNYKPSADEKGLTFMILNEIPGVIIKGDTEKIKQVLGHLVSNAVKFTREGSVVIRASGTKEEVAFSVTDSGIGIDKSDQEIIFDRFRQSETGLNRTYGGSGLGLAISKGNLNFLGGKIWLESVPGEGSVFSFSVPVEFLKQSVPDQKEPGPLQFLRHLRILVVEDDDIDFLYMREVLRESDCELVRARNGFEALDLYSGNKLIDIVLMDLKMPLMNGYEATRKIKAVDPDVPVIAISSFDPQDEMMKTSGIKFDGQIIKPIIKNDLLRKVNILISRLN